MKKNEFGEIENPRNKVNVFILVIAIIAVVVTGVIYAVKLNSQAKELEANCKNTFEYYQNQDSYI